MEIVKRDGEIVKFDRKKLKTSLMRVGLGKEGASDLAGSIASTGQKNVTTSYIYEKVLGELKKKGKEYAMRYSLRQAIFALGPTGFPFEQYIAELFRRRGWKVSTNLILKGNCVDHEVDVLARKEDSIAMELKFHNKANTRTDVKTLLYVSSRFRDLTKSGGFLSRGPKADSGLLVTNTKFTSNAIKYAECEGINLLGWDYPKQKNLRELIEETKVHPVTCLPSLSKQQIGTLIKNNIYTCSALKENFDRTKDFGIRKDELPVLEEEIMILCN